MLFEDCFGNLATFSCNSFWDFSNKFDIIQSRGWSFQSHFEHLKPHNNSNLKNENSCWKCYEFFPFISKHFDFVWVSVAMSLASFQAKPCIWPMKYIFVSFLRSLTILNYNCTNCCILVGPIHYGMWLSFWGDHHWWIRSWVLASLHNHKLLAKGNNIFRRNKEH
jgi:hypothetical protein